MGLIFWASEGISSHFVARTIPGAIPGIKFLVLEKTAERHALQVRAARQKLQFDEELRLHEFASHLADQLDRRRRSSARRQQIVDEDDLLPGLYGVHVHLHGRLAVLELVGGGIRPVRQLAFLAHGNETDPELISHGGAKQKTAR